MVFGGRAAWLITRRRKPVRGSRQSASLKLIEKRALSMIAPDILSGVTANRYSTTANETESETFCLASLQSWTKCPSNGPPTQKPSLCLGRELLLRSRRPHVFWEPHRRFPRADAILCGCVLRSPRSRPMSMRRPDRTAPPSRKWLASGKSPFCVLIGST